MTVQELLDVDKFKRWLNGNTSGYVFHALSLDSCPIACYLKDNLGDGIYVSEIVDIIKDHKIIASYPLPEIFTDFMNAIDADYEEVVPVTKKYVLEKAKEVFN